MSDVVRVIWLAPLVAAAVVALRAVLRQRAMRRRVVHEPPTSPQSGAGVDEPASHFTRIPTAGDHLELRRVAARRGIDLRKVARALPAWVSPRPLRIWLLVSLLTLAAGPVIFLVQGSRFTAHWSADPAFLCVYAGGISAVAAAVMRARRRVPAIRLLVLGINAEERHRIRYTEPPGSWQRRLVELHDAGWIRQFEGSSR